MDVFPAFRRRDVPGRGRYMRLENDSDTASQHSNRSRHSSLTSGRSRDSAAILCDRCWVRREREPATKRCLECKQNLCIICAKCDEVRRPWWLPTVIVQCWRFFFSKTFIPHSFVELYDDDVIKQRHWSHTQEASHIQPIPRVTRNSLRSNKNKHQSKDHTNAYDNAGAQNQEEIDHQSDILSRSRSFEGFKERRRVRQRRSRSVDGLGNKPRDRNATDAVWNNYHKRAESYENNWDNEDIVSSENFLRKKIMKGTDIDIELSADNVKVTVNYTDTNVNAHEEKESNGKSTCAVKKTKPKKDSKRTAPAPYTEKIFTDVPIWFKRSSSHKETPVSSIDNRNRISKGREGTDSSNKAASSSYDNREGKTRSNISSRSKTSSKTSNSSSAKYDSGQDEHKQFPQYTQQTGSNVHDWRHSRSPELGRVTDERSNGISNTCSYIVEEPPDQCPICLEDLPKSEARLLRCSHQIHTKCLKELLLSTDLDFGIRCPICNQMTTVKNYYAPKDLWFRELPISTCV